MRKALSALLGLMLLAAPAFADHHEEVGTNTAPATQGQLAHQLAWRLDLIGDGGSVADAVTRLNDYGVAPKGGWAADQNLTYGALDQVLHHVYGSWDTNFPDRVVTVSQLPEILESEDEVTVGFWKWHDNRWQWEQNRWEHRAGF